MQEIKVSIIIPIYNTKEYLPKCLDSIINQTLKEIEIICVNDGSLDESAIVLDEYAKKDSRIRIISKENGGLVSARKSGVAAAKGQYIGYVDSDDYIELEMYERLYEIASSYKVDLVTCGYLLEGNYTTKHFDTVEEGLYDEKRIQLLRDNTIYRLEKQETGLRGSLCCKLFQSELIKNAQARIPNEISIAEDKMCLLTYILECKSVYVLKEAYYHWIIHENSMSHRHNTNYLQSIDYVYNYLNDLYVHEKFTPIMRTQSELYIMELIFLGINKRLGFEHRNLIWIDPYWLDNIPKKSRIVLYGAGELGEKYFLQLSNNEDLYYVACVDPEYKKLSSDKFNVDSLDSLQHIEYDYIVITIKNPAKAEEIKKTLINMNISSDIILWFEQPEAYWKYAKAEGLLRSQVKESINEITEANNG